MLGDGYTKGFVMSLEDFLKKYYRQLHFNSMNPEVRARFMQLIEKDNLTDKMRLWVRDYMHLGPDGKYVQNSLPNTENTDDLPDDVAKELFLACQNAFVGMNGGRAAFKDSDPQSRDFLDQYFGQDKMFNVSHATDECERGITAITKLIRDDPAIKRWLLQQKNPEDDKKLFDNEVKLNEFLAKCDKGDYNTKGNVQSKIKLVAEAMERAAWQNLDGTDLAPIKLIKSHINNVIDSKAFAMNPDALQGPELIDFQRRFADFKRNINEPTGILQTLYKNKTIRSRFGKYDDGTITKIIAEKAEDEIDYQKKDSENYLTPKYEDQLTPLQQLEKWSKDTYNDTLRKYEELRGGHMFFCNEAKDICKAIDKVSDKEKDPNNKITPVNGLEKLLSRSEDVKKKLADNPVAKQHFTWFVETINGVKDDIPKAIEGCWKDAKQMKCVIDKIILKATDPQNDDPHAMEKAKTAMEIMTVMKYGMLTSKVMDALRKEEFSMFSDGKLSWNKNEGIQFVTKAFDKSVKAAFLGVGYGITIAKNKIKMRNMDYTKSHNKDPLMAARIQAEEERLASLGNTGKPALQAEIAQKQQEQTQKRQTLQGLTTGPYAIRNERDKAQLEQRKARIEQQLAPHKQARENAQREKDKQTAIMNAQKEIMSENQDNFELDQQLDDIIHDRDIDQKVNELQTQINDTQAEITRINNILNAPDLLDEQGNPITDKRAQGAYKRKLYEALGNLYDQVRTTTNQINQENAKKGDQQRHQEALQRRNDIASSVTAYKNAQTAYNDAEQIYNREDANYNNADAQYNAIAQQHDYQTISDKIDEFTNATKELEEINKVLLEKQTALNNWDDEHKNKVIELEKHWNFLNCDKSKTWRLFTSRAQAKFDSEKANNYSQFMARDLGD